MGFIVANNTEWAEFRVTEKELIDCGALADITDRCQPALRQWLKDSDKFRCIVSGPLHAAMTRRGNTELDVIVHDFFWMSACLGETDGNITRFPVNILGLDFKVWGVIEPGKVTFCFPEDY